MAVTDRNSKGKRTDYAVHHSLSYAGMPICGNKNYGCSTPEIKEVDCKRCLNKIAEQALNKK